LQVLLTERADDLDDYPGQLVFPGGAAEPEDQGPAATAVREAADEVGLDLVSIDILGVLRPVAMPDSGFLVHPVLGWSHQPCFSRSVNFAEVNALLHVPLSALGNQGGAPGAPFEVPGTGGTDLHELGRFTGDILRLVLAELAQAMPGDPTHPRR